ncbi:TetR/AcrR family transcriptional regulator; helix-turn-helix transcriptional regulator [Corallococcus sp. M34]|uniref:TetR/AcrR family transcriptional regulator n=1 Tax=Citreicoccus inhibens TaxID=2849499 RepID=UPI001C21B784|nr:TetR/AcrR family transcriptional regulator [Citreicoccus inhibens]MBU8895356.1 TetR/AcrR family transcriptional regulator; helix-turn-helix transcriptional regulator [Citreicoccus inhibens]
MAMVASILDAAIRVLSKQGYEAATTIAIAKMAGISVGSLYQYFPNKEAIVVALGEQHSREVRERLDAAFRQAATAEPRETLRAVIHATLDAHRVNPKLHRVFTEEVPRRRIQSGPDTGRFVMRRFTEFFEAQREALNGRTPQMAAFITETVIEALAHRAVIEPHEGLSTEDVAAEALELVSTYLFGPASGRRRGPSGSAKR